MSELSRRLQEAFWAAATATHHDESIHGLDQPYMDEAMETVDGHIPPEFWGHMAAWWELNGKW